MSYDSHHNYFKTAYQTGTDMWTRVVVPRRGEELTHRLSADSLILDMGAGRGAFAFELVRRGFRVIALESVPGLVEYGNQEAKNFSFVTKIRFVEGDAFDTPFTDASFDAVSDLGLLQHLKPEDEMEYLEEVFRVLKPKGLFYLIAFSKDTPTYMTWYPKRDEIAYYEKDGIGYHFYTEEELVSLVAPFARLLSTRTEQLYFSHDTVSCHVMLFEKK